MTKPDSIQEEIALFEQKANLLPQEKDIEILKKVRVIWVVSGSGSYLKPLINVASDQANFNNLWYYGTDKARLDYAERWLSAYSDILPSNQQPTLIYNGLEKQVEDLFKAIKEKKYQVSPNQIYIAPGKNVRTLDQVKNFSFPPNLDIKGLYLGLISHAPHLSRILRFMNKNKDIFTNIEVLALPLKIKDQVEEKKLVDIEIKGILDYIKKNKATNTPYPYKTL